jgi:hypothetical protein
MLADLVSTSILHGGDLYTRLRTSASVEAEDLRGASFPNWRGPSCLKLDRAAAARPGRACSIQPGQLAHGPPRCAHFLCHAFGPLRFIVMYISWPEDLDTYPEAHSIA